MRPDERALLADGQPLRLGGRAFDILLALIERRDRVVEFDELLDVVWPGLAVEENNLSVQVSALRKLIGVPAITTVRGKGYRFTAPVHEGQATAGAALHAAPLHSPPTEHAWPAAWPTDGAVLCLARSAAPPHAHADAAPEAAGALLFSSGWMVRVLEGLRGEVVAHDAGAVCLAFPQAKAAVRAALRARELAAQIALAPGAQGLPRIGIVAAPVAWEDAAEPDPAPPSPPAGRTGNARQPIAPASALAPPVGPSHPERADLRQAVHAARALAAIAAAGDIMVTAALAMEFIAGVDGDIDDLGELALNELAPGVRAPLHAFRVRASGGGAGGGHRSGQRSSGSDGSSTSLTFADGLALPLEAAPPDAALAALKPSIAVLPLECRIGGDPDDLLGEALAEDVIHGLSCSAALSVVSGLSSRRLRRYGLTGPQAAGCLSATFLLTGAYTPTPGGIDVRLQLQHGRSGEILHAMHFAAGLREAFDPADPLGHRIAQEAAQAVLAHTLGAARSRTLPEMASYVLLTGAIGFMHRATRQEFERARAMLAHLMQRPGASGVASTWLAKWHVLRVVQGWSPDSAADARSALDCVNRSLDEDSCDALALSVGGLVHAYLRKDLAQAGHMYAQAIDANPSEPLAWLFSATRLAYLGQGAQAQDAGERALRLSPIDPLRYFFDSLAATAALAHHDWERSVALSQRSLRANRSHASTWRTLAYALVMLERMDEAREAVQQLLRVEPGLTVSRFKDRFPGRDGPMAAPWADALQAAGLPA